MAETIRFGISIDERLLDKFDKGCLFFRCSALVRFFAPLKTGYKHPKDHKGKQKK